MSNKQAQLIQQARQLVACGNMAVLSTLSSTMPGYPFGSTVQYICDDNAYTPFLFISDLAQHTKNLRRHAKLSLTVFDEHNINSPEISRLTLLATAKQLPRPSSQYLIQQFVERIPEAHNYANLLDFNIWQLKIERVRFIAGFGDIVWFEQPQWCA
ncbi:pyridoxamine 5'-phosphate oxidase [Pseudoalteromonas sp. S16_S37]|nr:pyridoxamine 5'-phosphate oxidase [Pseudoalteromonas sp. S16_S37]